ncbi:MAG: hypothetical protein AAFW95_06650 [Cyanobacteria bacterium J06638_6]
MQFHHVYPAIARDLDLIETGINNTNRHQPRHLDNPSDGQSQFAAARDRKSGAEAGRYSRSLSLVVEISEVGLGSRSSFNQMVYSPDLAMELQAEACFHSRSIDYAGFE